MSIYVEHKKEGEMLQSTRLCHWLLRSGLVLAACSVVLISFPVVAGAREPLRINPPFPPVRVIPTSSQATRSLEDPGKIIVVDGIDCGETRNPGTEIELPGSFALPSYA